MSIAAGINADLVEGALDPVLGSVEADGTVEIVRQRLFRFEPGSEDKVYQVDLVKTDAEHFLVNFRFGRGELVQSDRVSWELTGKLSKGSKTVLPVGEEEAERIFAELVQSRLDRGYVDWDVSAKVTTESAQQEAAPLAEPVALPDPLPEEDLEATVSMDMPIAELSLDDAETEELGTLELHEFDEVNEGASESGTAAKSSAAGDGAKAKWWEFWK